MRLIVDGEIFQLQSHGGISAVMHALLPLLCDLAPDLRIDLLTAGRPRSPLPQHARIRSRPLLPVDDLLHRRTTWAPLQSRLRRLLAAALCGDGRDTIWLASFYAQPPYGWRGRSVALIYDLIHEQFPQLFAGRYYRQLRADKRRTMLRADRVIAISHATAAAVREAVPAVADRLRVVALACAPSYLQPPDHCCPPVAAGAFLLYVGRRNGYKNFDLLLQALSAPQADGFPPLVVAGPPWTDAEVQRLAALALTDRVRLVPNPDDRQLQQLYRSAAALVLPSLAEGFGLPVLEALASGALLVASDIPTTREIAGALPVYFRADDAAALRAALTQALSDPCAAVRRTAGCAVAARYSWPRSAHEMLTVLQELAI